MLRLPRVNAAPSSYGPSNSDPPPETSVGFKMGRTMRCTSHAQADAHRRAGLLLDAARTREVIGMHVGFQDFCHLPSAFGCGMQDHVGALGPGIAGAVVEVEHGINDGGLTRGRIAQEVSDGVGDLVEEALDQRFANGCSSLHIAPVAVARAIADSSMEDAAEPDGRRAFA
jgi:hypothetical protein